MNRFVIIIAVCCLCMVSTDVMAGQQTLLSEQEAVRAAQSVQDFDTALCIARQTDAYFIVSKKDACGYVVVSRLPDARRRILGFSLTSRWTEKGMPDALTEWLDNISSVGNGNGGAEAKGGGLQQANSSRTSIAPLITSHWHQDSPYNDLAPVITDGNIKTVAGCVAIAAAQIIYYWRNENPAATLKDTPTYIYGGAPVTVSIPKGTPNNWDLLRDSYTQDDSEESRAAVAQLCYVIGTTSYLNYANSTGGSIRDAATAMKLQYELLNEYVAHSKLSSAEWDELLYGELERQQPVLCGGNSGSSGHAFVLDGYDSATGLYHFNFGWGGSGDGYYPADGSTDAMGGYSDGQSIVYNIRPKSHDTPVENIKESTDEKDDVIYDLFGRRVTTTHPGTIYIIGGKKKTVL